MFLIVCIFFAKFFFAGSSLFSASFCFWQGVVHLCDWCFFLQGFFFTGVLFLLQVFSFQWFFVLVCLGVFFLPVFFLQWFVFVSFCCKVVCVCLFFAVFFAFCILQVFFSCNGFLSFFQGVLCFFLLSVSCYFFYHLVLCCCFFAWSFCFLQGFFFVKRIFE